MGSVGDAYDNAMAESFFASLECELIDRRSWQTKTEARLALFTYIEGWYNPRRRHSSLGQTSPANFERNHLNPIRSQHGLPTAGARVDPPELRGLAEATGSLLVDGTKRRTSRQIAEEAANILRLPAASIDPLRPLSEMGMDSLMAVELRLALENRLRIDLPLMSLAEGTSIASIAGRLAGAMSSRPQASQLVSLAERYEAADQDRLAAVAEAAEIYDPGEIKSAAAE